MIANQKARPEDLERYRPFLHQRARTRLAQRLRGKLDASDVVQQTFLQALEKLGQFRGRTEAELTAWLFKVLETTLAMAVRQFRAQARDLAREKSLRLDGEAATAGPTTLWLAEAPSPVEQALQEERALRLAGALERLRPDQRRAIELHHLQGRSVGEVAACMHKTRDAVAGLLARGLRKLRALLAESDEA